MTTKLSSPSKVIPQCLLEAFDKRPVRTTRQRGGDSSTEKWEVLVPLKPGEMTLEQRELIKICAQTVQS